MQEIRHQQEDQGQCGRNDLQSHRLDPDVERIRRKLVRLMAVSAVVTLLLVGAVLAAIIYKIMQPVSVRPPVAAPAVSHSEKPPAETILKPVNREIMLVPGTHLLSQSISGSLISLETLKPDDSIELIIYDYTKGQIIARLQISANGKSALEPGKSPVE